VRETVLLTLQKIGTVLQKGSKLTIFLLLWEILIEGEGGFLPWKV
jgi:hypothetical protein